MDRTGGYYVNGNEYHIFSFVYRNQISYWSLGRVGRSKVEYGERIVNRYRGASG
jgi:hypothetical protein